METAARIPGEGSLPAGPRPALLVIVGPTGTGKSELALTVAERIGGEIIGCDALQVYRGFDRATAKPSLDDRERVPHHLIDAYDPRQDFHMAAFVHEAERIVSEIARRGNVPLVVGGTGLYLRGLLRGIVDVPPRDTRLRDRLRNIATRRGPEALHRSLARRDLASAQRISPRDTQRLVRALELALTEQRTWGDRLQQEGTWAAGRERYRALKIGLDGDPLRLNCRLDARVDRFFDAGLVAEVRRLLERGVPPGANAFKAIGYREVLAALRSGQDPDAVREEVCRKTRRYAKRQRTWFRSEPEVVWLDAELGATSNAERVCSMWRGFREPAND